MLAEIIEPMCYQILQVSALATCYEILEVDLKERNIFNVGCTIDTHKPYRCKFHVSVPCNIFSDDESVGLQIQ